MEQLILNKYEHSSTEKPFQVRLENSLRGWRTADAVGLDKIGQRVGNLFKSLTCQDVLSNYDEFAPKFRDEMYRKINKNEVIQLFKKLNSYDTPIIEVIKRLRNDSFKSQNWKESHRIEQELNTILDLSLGASFHNWIEHNLKTNNQPKIQAKVVYLATGIENPFIFINEDVKKTAEITYANVQKINGNLNPIQKEVTITRYSTFLNETRYGANCKELNAWGYADQACKEALELIDNPSIIKKFAGVSQRFKKDLVLFCESQKCFPPQIFYIFDYIKKLYPQSTSYTEALTVFYEENPDGLYKYFDGMLNFVVSGINRIYERIDIISELNKSNQKGAYLSIFSGPPSISKQEAILTGCDECITIDASLDDELKSIKNGGKALLMLNELLPGQNPNQVLVEDLISNIKHSHIQGKLPDDLLSVEDKLKEIDISVISDKRGSGLYLEGQKKLNYLEWLFRLGQKHPGVIINYDTGVPNWLYVDLMLKRNEQGGYDIEDYFSGLTTERNEKTYIGSLGKLRDLYSGFFNSTIPDRDEIAKLISMNLTDDELELYWGSFIPVMDSIVEAFYYVVNPADINFKNFDFISNHTKQVIEYLQSIVSGKNDSVPSFYLNRGNTEKYLFEVLSSITPEVFHQIIYLFASKANVSVSREGIFYPNLCKSNYPINNFAKEQISNGLPKNDLVEGVIVDGQQNNSSIINTHNIMKPESKFNRRKTFYERLQQDLSSVIKFSPQEIKNYLKEYYVKPLGDHTHAVLNSSVPTDVMLKEDGSCISVIQRTYCPLSSKDQSPIIQLIETYNPGVSVWIPIYTHQSTTSSGLFFSHSTSETKSELAVGLKSKGTKKVIEFIEGQGVSVPKELKSSDREERWCLTQKNGVWYAEEFYLDHNKADFSYPIRNESLKELEIDNVPYHIKITDPAVAPTEIEVMIDGKKVRITMPPSIFSNKGIGLRDRILNGQSMMPIAVEVEGKHKKWSKTK